MDPFAMVWFTAGSIGFMYTVVIATLVKADQQLRLEQLVKKGGAINGTTYETEFQTTLRSPSFMLAVHDFFKSYRPDMERSVPRQLWYNWWEITERDPKSRLYRLTLKFLEPTEFATTTDCKLDMTIQLQPNPAQAASKVLVRWTAHALGGASMLSKDLVEYTIKELQMHTAKIGEQQATPAPRLRPTTASVQSTPAANIKVVKAVKGSNWPTPQDYNEAVQSPLLSFASPVLKDGTPELNKIGLPRAATGAFASVYRVSSRNVDYAVKCFLTLPADQQERFAMISKYVLSDDLVYTVDFAYEKKGILVRGEWYPILRMDWVEGLPLHLHVAQIVKEPAKVKKLADDFYTMMAELHAAGIAHGDLQHGNVIITKDGIRLVDYDGMYVPEMDGLHSNELGHRNYQHPDREPHHFGAYLDNFSAWVIFISLRMLVEDPTLWLWTTSGDECLLFKRDDFLAPDDSAVIDRLSNHRSGVVRELCRFLVQLAAECDPRDVPYLDSRFA